MGFGISIRIGDTLYVVPWYLVGVAILVLASIIRLIVGGPPLNKGCTR